MPKIILNWLISFFDNRFGSLFLSKLSVQLKEQNMLLHFLNKKAVQR